MLAPLTISHAACKGHAPENTLAGIRAALTLGVDAIEIDVRTSRDRIPVLMHDDRVDRTTDGTGLVRDLPLDITRDACLLVIEIKQRGIAEDVATIVRRLDARERTMIWSFHSDVVAAARAIMPEVPVAQLWSGVTGDATALIERAVQRNAQAVSVHFSVVDAALVNAARLRGLTVYTWTVDEPSDQVRAAAAGVAGICTNLPDVLKETLTAEQYSNVRSAITTP